MSSFAGGYFDANGVANYYLTDYQGNVTEVVNASGAVVQSVRYYPDGEPWMEPTGTNRYTFGGKERVSLGGLNQYDFGPRLLNAAASVWGAPDPASESYYHLSPYSYCAGNPVRYTDPSGCKIVGVAKSDILEFLKDLTQMMPGEEFQNFRSLLVVEKKGRALAPISPDDLAAAMAGTTLNEDQQALLDIVVNTINSKEKHIINYYEDKSILSPSASEAIKEHLPSKIDYDRTMERYNGIPSSVVENWGGGATFMKGRGTFSLIRVEYSHEYHPNGRAVTTGHEIFGHGRSLALGRKNMQHIDPIQFENLLLRVMGIDFVNTGINHGPEIYIPDHSALPSYR